MSAEMILDRFDVVTRLSIILLHFAAFMVYNHVHNLVDAIRVIPGAFVAAGAC